MQERLAAEFLELGAGQARTMKRGAVEMCPTDFDLSELRVGQNGRF